MKREQAIEVLTGIMPQAENDIRRALKLAIMIMRVEDKGVNHKYLTVHVHHHMPSMNDMLGKMKQDLDLGKLFGGE